MSKQNTMYRTKKTVEIVRPTEAEKREDMRVDISFAEFTKAVQSDADVRQTEKPSRERIK